jgi:hypothetical protein
VARGEFEDPVEHHPRAAGAAAVEAEHELVQVAREMRVVDGSLVGAKNSPLRQAGHAVHGGQQLARVVAASAGGPLAAPLVGVAEPGQPVVAHPGIGDDRRPWLDMAGDEGMQRRSVPVSQSRDQDEPPLPGWISMISGCPALRIR